jgi:hypothetical protein
MTKSRLLISEQPIVLHEGDDSGLETSPVSEGNEDDERMEYLRQSKVELEHEASIKSGYLKKKGEHQRRVK